MHPRRRDYFLIARLRVFYLSISLARDPPRTHEERPFPSLTLGLFMASYWSWLDKSFAQLFARLQRMFERKIGDATRATLFTVSRGNASTAEREKKRERRRVQSSSAMKLHARWNIKITIRAHLRGVLRGSALAQDCDFSSATFADINANG